jgi:serine/threonine protein kinase
MATSPAPAAPPRQKLFISYAREDTDWLEKFLPYFKPAERSGALEIWWDRQIPSGADWGPILDTQIADATAALVLVSVNLLNSNFILERELPAIHEQRRTHNLQLYWIPVSMVGEEVLQTLGLFGINAAAPCEPGKPLDDMEDRERELAVVAVCNQILRDLKSGRVGRLSQEKRDDIFGGALARLREKVALAADAPIAFGDFSIVSRGQMQGRDVAIKVLAESPFREHNSEFEERVKKALNLEDGCFLKLRYCEFGEEPQVLVSDYTDAPTLAQYLAKTGKPFPPSRVTRLIQRLALAIQEYHQKGLRYGLLASHNVFYDEDASPEPILRLQAIAISSHLSQSDETPGRFPRDAAEATYLAPEQYEGKPYTELSDQYGIGLIALEMLEGRPPVTVTRLADLEAKRRFYEDPGQFAGTWQRDQSRLRSVIFRMLQKDPAQRFAKLADAYHALAHLEPADVVLAKKSYSRVCAGKAEFYAAFYQQFFARCPEAVAMFANLKMEDQYAKLDSALHYLLNFADMDMTEPTSLTHIALRHARLQITGKQFNDFAEALLATLRQFGEAEAVEAWERTIRPGVQYLKIRSAQAQK